MIAEIEACADPAAKEQARALVAAVLELHREALARAVEIVGGVDAGAGAAGRTMAALAADDLVASVLLLHDLHPIAADERVARALEAEKKRLAMHGAEVVAIDVSPERDGA